MPPVGDVRCDAGNVVIRSADPIDAATACQGASDAIAFLARNGMEVSGGITIEVVRHMPEHTSATSAGCYLEVERRALILRYAEFERGEPWLGLPRDRKLYRSLVSHEVAHALAACNFKVPKPSISAQEYIAYVTMLATMAPEERERVLSQFPGEGYEGDWQMNSTIYMMNPERFAVQAYRHYLKPDNGWNYLREILSGRVMIE